ncbi:MAG: Hsp20/alpha crystallin family protein [Myxococcales bacterium]|nr:Hsp20/alpha crystallin family protein [Myxococcales bacterium]
MLTQWDPFSEISRLQNDFFRRNRQDAGFRPAVDIYQDDKGIHVRADVAGVSPEDIKVEVENRVLTISGERKLEKTSDEGGYHRVERQYGSFSRSFALAEDVDPESIKADYRNGVLNVLLPKSEVKARKQIAVNG